MHTLIYFGGAGAAPAPRGAEKACASKPSVRFRFSTESPSDSSLSFPPIILVNNDPFLHDYPTVTLGTNFLCPLSLPNTSPRIPLPTFAIDFTPAVAALSLGI